MKITPEQIIKALNWRYAVQVFDTNKPVDERLIKTILEAARLSPSSIGIEPWKFIVVENKDIRRKLYEVGYKQPKIIDAPVLVVIAYRTDARENISKERIERTAKTLKVDPTQLDGLKAMLDRSISSRDDAQLEAWVKSQVYIPLGIIIETAALLGVDSGPMEGFDANGVDQVLGLKEKNLHSTSMIAFGYRGGDEAQHRPKVRRLSNEVIEYIK